MTGKLNRCYFQSANSGDTDPHEYASAVSGFMSPSDAGAVDGAQYAYIAENGSPPTQWEIGIGTYTASSGELSRTTIVDSSNAGAAVNFSAAPKVRMGVPLATDFPVEKIASADFGAIPAASFSFDLDITKYASVSVVWDGVRLDAGSVEENQSVLYVLHTVQDASENTLLTLEVENLIFAESFDNGGGVELTENAPIKTEVLISISSLSAAVQVPSHYSNSYIDGVFDAIGAIDPYTTANNFSDEEAGPVTIVLAPLIDGTDPIDMVAGTITVIGIRK